MSNEDNLDKRLRALEADGWRLRVCHTLKKPDRKEGWQSFHGETLEAVVARAEREARNPDPKPKRPQAQSGPVVDEAMEKRLQSSLVHEGLVSTTTYNQ